MLRIQSFSRWAKIISNIRTSVSTCTVILWTIWAYANADRILRFLNWAPFLVLIKWDTSRENSSSGLCVQRNLWSAHASIHSYKPILFILWITKSPEMPHTDSEGSNHHADVHAGQRRHWSHILENILFMGRLKCHSVFLYVSSIYCKAIKQAKNTNN